MLGMDGIFIVFKMVWVVFWVGKILELGRFGIIGCRVGFGVGMMCLWFIFCYLWLFCSFHRYCYIWWCGLFMNLFRCGCGVFWYVFSSVSSVFWVLGLLWGLWSRKFGCMLFVLLFG